MQDTMRLPEVHRGACGSREESRGLGGFRPYLGGVIRTGARLGALVAALGLAACADIEMVQLDLPMTAYAPMPERVTRNIGPRPDLVYAPRAQKRPDGEVGDTGESQMLISDAPAIGERSVARDLLRARKARDADQPGAEQVAQADIGEADTRQADKAETATASVDPSKRRGFADPASGQSLLDQSRFDPMTVPEASAAMRRVSLEAFGGDGFETAAKRDARSMNSGASEQQSAGDAGIFGTVTGFGSIYVNGIRIETEAGATRGLEIGDVVAVHATERNGALRAASIEEVHALIGPLTSEIKIGAAHQLEIMGVSVTLAPEASIIDEGTRQAIDPYALVPGDRLAVSGLWQGEAVIANRVELLKDSGRDHVAGVLRRDDEGVARIGPIEVTGEVLADELGDQKGRVFARVYGRFFDARFESESLKVGIPQALAQPGVRLSIEGFLLAGSANGAPSYLIDGLGLTLDPGANPSTQVAGGRAILIGESDVDAPGVFRPRQGVPLPNAFDRRLKILDEIGDGFEPSNGAPLR